MEEKTGIICSSCGQEIMTGKAKKGETIYCEKCKSSQTMEQTIAFEEGETIQSPIPDKTLGLGNEKSVHEKTIDPKKPGTGGKATIKLSGNVAATSIKFH